MDEKVIVRRASAASNHGRLFPELPAVLERIYRARKVSDARELDRSLQRLAGPNSLKGIAAATELLAEALARDERIMIVADFDADGATSCALARRALQSMGASDVRYIVPNRFDYGYGLTPEIVALAAQQAPRLLITVDNGISSHEGVRAAQALGIQVLITDHHLPGAELPPAEAIVNPNQPGDEFASKNLAGVGVVFYLMTALRARLRTEGWYAKRGIDEPNLAQLLDLVALGTVADLVPLDHNNRILVAQGLARINAGQCCEGVRALLEVAGRKPGRLSTIDLGYFAAPRLNAAGRLQDMSLGIACLLSDDASEAQGLAVELDRLNRERRGIEQEMQAQAVQAVDRLRLDGAALPRGLCLYDEGWHQGIVGLVASRIKDRTHRPVIAFAPAGGEEIKGSARSVPGLHIRDALEAIAARHPRMLNRFGGHAMAAGLTLARADLERFGALFDEEVGRWLSEDELKLRILSDGELAPQELNLELAERLRDGGPWGQGFPQPLFDGEFEVVDRRVVGEKHLKLLLRSRAPASPRGAVIDAIAFNYAPEGQAPPWAHVRAAYRLEVNEYQGARAVQLVIEHLQPVKN